MASLYEVTGLEELNQTDLCSSNRLVSTLLRWLPQFISGKQLMFRTPETQIVSGDKTDIKTPLPRKNLSLSSERESHLA